jgi:tRNA (mo5U34)-methyltransferase
MNTNDLEDEILSREWFYRFTLPSGRATTPYVQEDVASLHDGRLAMMDSFVERQFDKGWSGLRVLDIACHQGFFASHVARQGGEEVVGLDVREQNIADARLIKEVYSSDNLTLVCRDVFGLTAGELGEFDAVLLLGLLYHVENPVGLLRLARSHTKHVCLVETQTAPNLSGVIDWGSYRYTHPIVGSFAVIDESSEVDINNREANTVSISMCPSVEVLEFVMRAVGFSRTEVLPAPAGCNEQLNSGKRVIMVGYVD